ncbi:hypothetical protein ScPMuIL_017057 [Solemya velum]
MESYQTFLESERRKRHCDIQRRSYRRRQLRVSELERQVQSLMWENRHLHSQGYQPQPLVPHNGHALPASRVPLSLQHRQIFPQDPRQMRQSFNRHPSPDTSRAPYFLPELDAIKELSQRSGSEPTPGSHSNQGSSPLRSMFPGTPRTDYGGGDSSHGNWRGMPQKRPYSAEGVYADSRPLQHADHKTTAMSEPRSKRQHLPQESDIALGLNLPVVISHELDAMKKMYTDDKSTSSQIVVKQEPIEINEIDRDDAPSQKSVHSPDKQSPDNVHRHPLSSPSPLKRPPSRHKDCSSPRRNNSLHRDCETGYSTPTHAALCVSQEINTGLMSPRSSFGSPHQTTQDIDMAIIYSEIHQLRSMVCHLQASVDKIAERLGPDNKLGEKVQSESSLQKPSADWNAVHAKNCEELKCELKCEVYRSTMSPMIDTCENADIPKQCYDAATDGETKLTPMTDNENVADNDALNVSSSEETSILEDNNVEGSPSHSETLYITKENTLRLSSDNLLDTEENAGHSDHKGMVDMDDLHDQILPGGAADRSPVDSIVSDSLRNVLTSVLERTDKSSVDNIVSDPQRNSPSVQNKHPACITMEELGLELEHKQVVIDAIKSLLQLRPSS